MSRPRLTLIVNNDVPCDQLGTSADSASWSNQFDPYALKVSAPDLWSAYFHARFHSPREVALFCDVSFPPASHTALLMILTDRSAAAFFQDYLRRAA